MAHQSVEIDTMSMGQSIAACMHRSRDRMTTALKTILSSISLSDAPHHLALVFLDGLLTHTG